jgi:hypothetical protein
MLTEERAKAFSHEWVSAWNSRNLNVIISHYDDNVVFYSPMIVILLQKADGNIVGKEPLAAYFKKGLEAYPDLNFSIYNILVGIDSIALHYRSVMNLQVVEVMYLNEQGKIVKVVNHYAEAKA